LDELASEIHEVARSKGFYDKERLRLTDDINLVEMRPVNPSLPSEKLMLIVTEVAEVQEALRDEDSVQEAEELADVLIRVLDYAAWRGISLDAEVTAKVEKNRQRPYLHGRKA
jgi:NTP pyrophosphatase (non-canonical NTP hydrolase)